MNIRNAKKFRRTLAALVNAVYFLLTLYVPTVLMQGSVIQVVVFLIRNNG